MILFDNPAVKCHLVCIEMFFYTALLGITINEKKERYETKRV